MWRQRLKYPWLLIASAALSMVFIYFLHPFRDHVELDNLRYLATSAGRMMDRHMQFYENYASVSLPEKAIHDFLFGPQREVENEVIQAYWEVLQHLGQPKDDIHLATQINLKARLLITIAEKHPLHELTEALKQLGSDPQEEVLAELIQFAYFGDPQQYRRQYTVTANTLPHGWAADRLRIRIADKIGNDRLVRTLQERLERRGEQHRRYVLQMVITITVIIVVGLYLMIRYRVLHILSPWPPQPIRQPWSFSTGISVTVTAALLGLLVSIGLHWLPDRAFFTPNFFTAWSTLFASLPMLWLIHHYLLKPHRLSFRQAFGLRIPDKGLRHFFTTTGALLALDWVGLLLIGWGTWKLGMGSHWTEGMQERLVFGPQQTVWLSAINIVIWAAIFEEIGFRGLLYTSLRQRLSPTLAIVISALIFSSVHLNSWAGFLSIFWSGLILAYAYERYHSLLPGMVIHASGNLLSLAPVLLFYR